MRKGLRPDKTDASISAFKSTVRSRVERIFAEQKGGLTNLFIGAIGAARARVKICMANLVQNVKRLVFWQRTVAADPPQEPAGPGLRG